MSRTLTPAEEAARAQCLDEGERHPKTAHLSRQIGDQRRVAAAKSLHEAEAALDRTIAALDSKPLARIPAPPPGMYPNTPFETYLAWDLPSQSTLKPGLKSAAHLKSALDNASEFPVSDAMRLGTVLHMAFLEPEQLLTRVAIWDRTAKNGSGKRAPKHGEAWDDFQLEHAGKIILVPEQFERMSGMLKSLRAHPFVKRVTSRVTGHEVAFVGEVNHVMMKCRVDILTDDVLDAVIDPKSVRDADKNFFTRQIASLGYHIQGHVNRRLAKRKRFILLAVESSPPFDVVPYELSEAWLDAGQKKLVPVLDAYKHGMSTGSWPGRSTDGLEVPLEPPEWVLGEDGASHIVFPDDDKQLAPLPWEDEQ